jgi:protein subunit release factor A
VYVVVCILYVSYVSLRLTNAHHNNSYDCFSAGGQKINKTSNRVILVHIPTQLRVECQDTRSLQQNRKIARKRLQLKLDDYINGDASRSNQKASVKVAKRQRTKLATNGGNSKRRRMRQPGMTKMINNADGLSF